MIQLLIYSNNNAEVSVNRSDRCIESGATRHFCCVREIFATYVECDGKIVLDNQICVEISGRGYENIDSAKITLKNVYHAKEIPLVEEMMRGMRVVFKDNK